MSQPGERRTTTFYGSCKTCGEGYWADVDTITMCGPSLIVVCQRHLPVADVELLNSGMFSHVARRQWNEWREEVDA